MNYVVDTCIFNKLVEGKISLDVLPQNSSYFASHIQIDEINNTNDAERRSQLFLKFAKVRPEIVPTESMVWGHSRWGQSKMSDGTLYNNLKQSLDKLKRKRSNIADALIAETAINNGYTLLTTDSNLAEVAEKLECKVHFFDIV